jgi:hypothetical protein
MILSIRTYAQANEARVARCDIRDVLGNMSAVSDETCQRWRQLGINEKSHALWTRSRQRCRLGPTTFS